MWRDGVNEKLPLIPPVEGFPLNDYLPDSGDKLPNTLGEHPTLKKVHAISDVLCDIDYADNLGLQFKPIRILESGHKSTGRIIEKVAGRGPSYMPSDLPDLARAKLLAEDIRDIPRFQEILISNAQKSNNEVIVYVPLKMRVSGYYDSRAVFKSAEHGLKIETQALPMEQRHAETKSHRIYEFKREFLSDPASLRGDLQQYEEMVEQYNALLKRLQTTQDKVAGTTIKEYSEARLYNGHDDIYKTIFRFQPLDTESLREVERDDVIEHIMQAVDDLHQLYHIAAARQSQGAAAALQEPLFDKMLETEAAKLKAGDLQAERSISDKFLRAVMPKKYTPQESDDLGHGGYASHQHYTEHDMVIAEEVIKACDALYYSRDPKGIQKAEEAQHQSAAIGHA